METQSLGGDFLIQLRAEGARANYNPWEPGDDKILFQLGVSDIEAVRDALGITALCGSHGGLTIRSHYEAYSEIMRRSHVTLAPSDKETLARWDRWSLTARHFDETSQEPDYPRRDRDTYKSLAYWDSDNEEIDVMESDSGVGPAIGIEAVGGIEGAGGIEETGSSEPADCMKAAGSIIRIGETTRQESHGVGGKRDMCSPK
ncbi:hypothetical protein PFICI_07586 [Pestalotiopsis fici W106-1]|uniref:Uncharacterized protein n=1 Tax=Pestalotiopsis fici (strain W106-1 / CGMCC3.15140) TaxID=1229662 RepID=W3X3R6_PESFW|nr:uncharacterized protein PFICI_07586 [Pestalotiopsis fici W106-1]ETS80057.1 hypothetical protein PFICI_07586 [Pestalotiopsis fici W106-1]